MDIGHWKWTFDEAEDKDKLELVNQLSFIMASDIRK